MGMMEFLLGRKSGATADKGRHSRPAPSTQFDSQYAQGGNSAQSVRKDLLRLVMRETLTRNGIPPTWLSADLLRTSTPKKESGLHVRFLVKHWDPRLLEHSIGLETEFRSRLLLLDPQANQWLMGFSWQFTLEDAGACPALPHPSFWTAPPAPSSPAPLMTVPAPLSSGDVIEGPALLASSARPLDDVRADLERLLALRDDDMRRHHGCDVGYAPTTPAAL